MRNRLWGWEEWILPMSVGAAAGFITGGASLLSIPGWLGNLLLLIMILLGGTLLASHERFLYRDSFRFGFVMQLVHHLMGQLFQALQFSNNPELAELDNILEPLRSHNPIISVLSFLGTAIIMGALVGLLVWAVVAATSFIKSKAKART
jgi:hypothetical protein